jgi:hypothetical protein
MALGQLDWFTTTTMIIIIGKTAIASHARVCQIASALHLFRFRCHDSVVIKALCHKPGGRGFQTR